VSIAGGLSTPKPLEGGELSQWLPAIFWAITIFVFSTSYFSAANTGKIIEPILRWLLPSATVATIDVLHWFVRKSAHFTEYVILFWLLMRGPFAGRPHLALAVCVAYAFLDEGHQILVPGRTPSIYDVGLDFSGALFSRFLHMAIFEIA
jgi:VanZ family protein